MSYVTAWFVIQDPWKLVGGNWAASFLPEGASEAAMFAFKNYTHTDTIVRYYCQIRLSSDQVLNVISASGAVPSLKYYIADASLNCAYTNGGISIGATLSWTAVKADVDANDTEVPRASYVVDTLSDSGTGSLREAVEAVVSAGTVKEITFDGIVTGIIDLDTPLEPVGQGVVRGETAAGVIVLRNHAGTATALELYDDTNTPQGGWAWYHITYAPCVALDGAFGVHIGAGWSDIYHIYCSGRYGGGEVFHHYHPYHKLQNQPWDQPNTRIAFIRCIIARPFSSHNVGMFWGVYNASEDGGPYTSGGHLLTSKFLAYKCAFLASGHRNPLIGVGSSSQLSAGGGQVINCCGYAFSESSFYMSFGGEAAVDSINNYIVSRKATAPSLLESDCEYRSFPDSDGTPSIYENGSICYYADNSYVEGQNLWHLNHTDTAVQEPIPESWWRETPMDNWYGVEIDTAAAAWQDVIVGQNVGAGAGLGNAFRTVGDITDLNDAANGTLTYPLNGDDIADYGGAAMLAAVS